MKHIPLCNLYLVTIKNTQFIDFLNKMQQKLPTISKVGIIHIKYYFFAYIFIILSQRIEIFRYKINDIFKDLTCINPFNAFYKAFHFLLVIMLRLRKFRKNSENLIFAISIVLIFNRSWTKG